MLLRTIRCSKFYKTLIGGEEDLSQNDHHVLSDEEDNEEQQRGSNHEASLQKYRHILNKLMREIVKLNQSAEVQAKANEVYRVKLLNAELFDKLKKV